MSVTLEFDSLELTYGTRTILSSIYMKCEVGEVIGILGRNGSGKSSLMKIVFGSLKPTYKSIRINGNPLPSNHITGQRIGYLPQHNLIPPYISVRKAIKLFRIDEDEILSPFPEVKNFLEQNTTQLSGGYRRILEALLILKSKTQFCILDEPFSGLMPVHVEKMKELIIAEKNKKGIIITDHLYRDVISITNRLYLLANGKTYAVKSEEDLISRGYINAL